MLLLHFAFHFENEWKGGTMGDLWLLLPPLPPVPSKASIQGTDWFSTRCWNVVASEVLSLFLRSWVQEIFYARISSDLFSCYLSSVTVTCLKYKKNPHKTITLQKYTCILYLYIFEENEREGREDTVSKYNREGKLLDFFSCLIIWIFLSDKKNRKKSVSKKNPK